MNKDVPLVSVILLNKDGAHLLERNLDSLFNQSIADYEVIFVDNGSKDNSIEVFLKIARRYPRIPVKIVALTENLGYSAGNVEGFKVAQGKYIVLLSNDLEVHHKWLEEGIRLLERNPEIGAAESLLMNYWDRERVDLMGNLIDPVGYCHSLSRVKLGEIIPVFYAEGASFFTKRSVIEEVGGLFDVNYFMFYEDIDFCWRIQLRGYSVVINTRSIAYHMRGGTVQGTITKMDPLFFYLNTRNRLATLFKNYGPGRLILYLTLSITLEILKSIFFIMFRAKRDTGLAGLRGVTAFLRWAPRLRKRRGFVQATRSVPDELLVRRMVPLLEGIKRVFSLSKTISKGIVNNGS